MNPKTTALLTLDLQQGIFQMVPNSEAVLAKAAQAVEHGRKLGLPILHVGLGFAEGHPEIPDTHPMFGQIKKNNMFVKGTASADFPAAIKKPGDIIVYKQRVSGFSENQLDMILRAKGINTLVLMGVATSGIVLSTQRQAFDMDYQMIVIRDACFDRDDEVHRILTEKIFPRQAAVMTADEFAHAAL